MKILIDARLYGLENAGLGRYSLNLIQNLASIDQENEYEILLREKYAYKLQLPANFHQREADIKHYSFAEQTKLLSLTRQLNFDFAHFLHFNVPLRFKKPYVVTIHDLIMHAYKGKDATTLPSFLYGFKRLGYNLAFRNAVINAQRIIVPSNFVKDELFKYYKVAPEKVTVVYEGVDNHFVVPKARESVLKKYQISSPYFIYTGNAYPHKNLKRAVEAVVLLNKQYQTPILLVIASSRTIFTKRLEKIINENKAENYVKMLGFVPDRELAILYRKSLGFLYPSLYEGFGLPGLEAMSCGTITLASDIPVFKEIYKDAAMYFNPYDFSQMARVMQQCIELDRESRIDLLKKGLNQTKKYSWAKMAKQTMSVYEAFT